jgi:tetratricopeptide (TPR) repeat protein
VEVDVVGNGGATNLATPAERWYQHGMELVRRGRLSDALEPLEQAMAYSAEEPDAHFLRPLRSYYGLAVALTRGELLRGRRLCEESIAGGPLRADLYVNLARVYKKAGRKQLAVEALLTALSVTPNDRAAWTLMAELGWRRPPVFGFLPRRHPVNKYLGLVRHRVFGAAPAPS